jgi:hypothetical protein
MISGESCDPAERESQWAKKLMGFVKSQTQQRLLANC